jgi:hypothetical protein
MSKAPPNKNDAVDLLDADHIAVKKLFVEFKKLSEGDGSPKAKKTLADRICNELTVHMRLEEEIFYPPVRKATQDHALLDEAEVEHASGKSLIAQITAMGPEEDKFDAKVLVLGEYIDHHVTEEREELFPEARKSDVDLVAMVPVLEKRKAELMAMKRERASA